MAQNVVLKSSGLHTFSNYLSSVPEGSLVEALNVIIDRNNIIEPRRGFFQYGNTFLTSADRTKQLISYKNKVLRHVGTALQYDSDDLGTFLPFTGSISEVSSGVRLKSIEANGNLYIASSVGIQKLSASSSSDFSSLSLQMSGGVKALDVSTMPNYSSTGFLEPNKQVAYRIVWGIKDANENLILGSPSNRSVVENISSTQSCTVDLTFAVPDDVTSTEYFYQVYRTGVFTSDPGEEMYLVFEDFITSAQITAGIVNVSDITPEDFRRGGTLLYTNPQSGEGISQANEKPPFAQDISDYKGYTFYGNTSTVHRLNLSNISITQFVSGSSAITITDGTTSKTYTLQGTIETYTADFSNGGLVASDFYNPGSTGKYFTLDSANDERKYTIWYKRTNETDPNLSGRISVMVDVTAGTPTVTDIRNATDTAILAATDDFNITRVASPLSLTIANSNNGYVTAASQTTTISNFSITTDGLGTGEDTSNPAAPKVFLPRVPSGTENGPTTAQQIEQFSSSLVRVVNKVDTLVYAFYLSGFNDVPGQILFERALTTGSAFYLQASSSSVGSQFTPELPTTGSSVISTNEIKPNRVYYSKYQQPEAVPLVNYIDIGPKDKAIKRIIALRDSLFIFKEDGIYRLTGDIAPFQISPFDFSIQVKAADTAVVLNNQIYALSTQGVITVTDTGVSVVSRPIENLILNVTKEGFDYITTSFGVAYESDRAYHLWTVTETTDTVATQCYRFNTFTQSWTRWDKSATCGIVNFFDDKLYLGAGDKNWVDKERKSLTRNDHTDREFELEIVSSGVNGEIVELTSVSDVEIGDRVIQEQYLTLNIFNRLLKKLDIDPQVNDTDYFSLLEGVSGNNLRLKIVSLSQKLDADLGISASDYEASIDNYVQTITTTTPGTQTVLNFASNNILTTRYITISGSNTVPSIDGTHEVIARTATSVTIDFATSGAGTTGTVQTANSDFRDIQACFNIMVNKLNSDPGVFYSNYSLSSGTVEFEGVVEGIDDQENTLTLDFALQYVEGPITLYKGVQTRIIWNPQFFQDPSIFKQVREGTVLFENTNYSTMTVSYSTDLSPSFVSTIVSGLGNGDFGQFNFGSVNFGGIGAAVPIRTYIPQQKQRCRFMNVKIEHRVAREKFSLYGISLTFRPYSTRGYK